MTGVLRYNKPQKKAHNDHGIQSYCVIIKKVGMPEQNQMSHSSEDCTGMCTKQTNKYGMKGYVGSRTDTVKQYKNSGKK